MTTYFQFVNSGRWDDYLSVSFSSDIVMDEYTLGAFAVVHIHRVSQLLKHPICFRLNHREGYIEKLFERYILSQHDEPRNDVSVSKYGGPL